MLEVQMASHSSPHMDSEGFPTARKSVNGVPDFPGAHYAIDKIIWPRTRRAGAKIEAPAKLLSTRSQSITGALSRLQVNYEVVARPQSVGKPDRAVGRWA